MENSELYYRESGKIGIGSILSIFLAGIPAAAVLGFAYGYALYYIPFIYLNIIITALFGMGVGLVIAKVAHLTKVRNQNSLSFITFSIGVVAAYFGWVFWLYAASEQTLLEFNPFELFQTLKDLASEGVWSIFGYTPKGFALYIIWAIEAIIIMVTASAITIMQDGEQPFCEKCNSWTEQLTISENLSPVENLKELVSSLKRNDLSELMKLVEIDPKELIKTTLLISNCTNCNNTYFLMLKSITESLDKDGGRNKDEDVMLIKNLVLSNEAYAEIMKWKSGLKPPTLEETTEKMKNLHPDPNN
jgi:hypothetical protein